MSTDHKLLKVTYENHGEVHSFELPWDSSLPAIVKNMMYLLVASGWSQDNIAELFQNTEQTIWEWEI